MSAKRPRVKTHQKAPGRPVASRSLTLASENGQPLSPKQKAFNRLITRIEKLQSTLVSEQQQLDGAFAYFSAHVRPRRTKAIALRTELVLLLRPFLSDNRLRAADRKVLKTITITQLDDVLAVDPKPSGEIRELFQQLHGQSYDEALRDDMEAMRTEMQDMFGEMGLDVELSGFTPDMSEDDMAAQQAEFAAQLREQARKAMASAGPPQSKREARKAERQARIEEARKTTLSSIYRRLARVLHPDLEPDPAAREHKGAIMQELTAAHARRDLHTLLRLELEWIHHEGSDTSRLADDALAIYTEALKQQADQLEFELSMLREHPKYAEMMTVSEFGFPTIPHGPTEVKRLDYAIQMLSAGITRLKASDALEEVRQTVQQHRADVKRRW